MACAFILFLLYYSGLQDLWNIQVRMLAFRIERSINLIGRMSAAKEMRSIFELVPNRERVGTSSATSWS